MLAYHNYQEIKAQLLSRIEEDLRENRIQQGVYWNGVCGCLIGCTTRDESHALYTEMFGIPTSVAWILDRVFESLQLEDAQRFVLLCHQAISPGADLALLPAQFVHWLLTELIHLIEKDQQGNTFPGSGGEKAIQTIQRIANLYQRLITGKGVRHEWIWLLTYDSTTWMIEPSSSPGSVVAQVARSARCAIMAQVLRDYPACYAETITSALVAYPSDLASQKQALALRDKLLELLAAAPVERKSPDVLELESLPHVH